MIVTRNKDKYIGGLLAGAVTDGASEINENFVGTFGEVKGRAVAHIVTLCKEEERGG